MVISCISYYQLFLACIHSFDLTIIGLIHEELLFFFFFFFSFPFEYNFSLAMQVNNELLVSMLQRLWRIEKRGCESCKVSNQGSQMVHRRDSLLMGYKYICSHFNSLSSFTFSGTSLVYDSRICYICFIVIFVNIQFQPTSLVFDEIHVECIKYMNLVLDCWIVGFIYLAFQ